MLENIWMSGISSYKQEHYKPVTKCTYWPVLGPFNNSKIIQLSHKSNPYDKFYETHRFFLDGISEIMDSLVEQGKYGAIHKH